MQKESQTQFVHRIVLGERETLSNEAAQPLPQRVVPSLDMRRQATLFAYCGMLLRRDDQRVSFPKVTVTMSRSIVVRDMLPEFATGRRASVTDRIGHDLAGGATQGNPDHRLLARFRTNDWSSSNSSTLVAGSAGSGSTNVSLNSGSVISFF
jgi:hypothetical protein